MGLAYDIGAKGGAIASQALSNWIDNMFGARAAEQNAAINYKYNEMAAENADRRTRALYEDYMSPASRIAQLKAAGLSPSLYADGAGAGSQGVTAGAQGSGAGGVGLPTNLMSAADAANIRLTNAQAEKAEAEANEIKGENERGQAEIQEIWNRAGAHKATELYTKTQDNLAKINVYVAEQTKDFNVTRVKYETNKAMDNARTAYWEAEDAGLSFHLHLDTYQSEVEKAALQVAELASRIALEKSQTALNDAEKNSLKHTIVQGYMDLVIKAENAEAYSKQVEAYSGNLPKMLELRSQEIGLEKWRIGMDVVNNLIRTAGYVAGASQLGDGGTNTDEMIREYGADGKMKTTQRNLKTTKLPKGVFR